VEGAVLAHTWGGFITLERMLKMDFNFNPVLKPTYKKKKRRGFKGKASPYCQFCGRVGYTERHHIIPRSRGGEDTEENRIDLCVYCHGKAHEGKIKPEELKKKKGGK